MFSEFQDTQQPPGKELRCFCGQLLARILSVGVELKCKRCKRIQIIPWTISKDKI